MSDKKVDNLPDTQPKKIQTKLRPAKKFKAFQKLLFNNLLLTPTECALQIYDCKDKKVAAVIASQNLTKLNLTHTDIMERMGLSDEEDVADLIRLRKAKKVQSCNILVSKDADGNTVVNENSNDFIEVDDNHVQLKALELTCRLKGKLNNDKSVVNNNQVNLIFTTEEKIDRASRIKEIFAINV
jgi:hypothetical protein